MLFGKKKPQEPQKEQPKSNVMQELNEDELEDVSGAGNPFANLPRVPTQQIDDNLRNKG